MRHPLRLRHVFAFTLGACPWPGRAEEPCAVAAGSGAALYDALRAGDARDVSSAWEALVHDGCLGEPTSEVLGSWTAEQAVLDAWDWLPERTLRGSSWVPAVSVAASAAPAWRASTRLDAGRTVGAGVDWSVGVSLRFGSQRRAPSLGWSAELSRSDARRAVDDAASAVTLADTTSLSWRIGALARQEGARVDRLLQEARARRAAPPAADLRARVLHAVSRQEELALLAAWLGVGARP